MRYPAILLSSSDTEWFNDFIKRRKKLKLELSERVSWVLGAVSHVRGDSRTSSFA